MPSQPGAGSTRALIVWIVGLAAYVLAVFHRSSLAVAGLAATDRFGISAAQLSTFVMVQLVVYAGMQIPVGLLLDRFGPRRVMGTGVVLMTVAQLGFALADSYPLAIVARVFVGLGDAMTFVCLLRLVTTWFGAQRIPLITQLTGVSGQLGALVAAAPMTWALSQLGWTRSYMIAAGAGVVVGLGVFVLVRDSPERRSESGEAFSWTGVRHALAESWAHPGTRLGFWTHFTTQFSATTLSLLWGYPFFVRGEGRSDAEAGLLLSVLVVATMSAGPILGWAVGRYPWQRSTLVLSIIGSIAALWTVVLAWPGEAPLWVLMVLVAVVAVGGPASMVGFDFSRSFNPVHRLGTANGIINQAGFIASLLVIISIGLVLDWRTAGATAYTPEAFRWAMSVQYVFWAVGSWQVLKYRRLTRAWVIAGTAA